MVIVGAVAIPRFNNMLDNMHIKVSDNEMYDIVRGIMGDADSGYLGYLQEMGTVPPGDTTPVFRELYEQGTQPNYNPVTQTGWNGPYIPLSFQDPDGDGDFDDGGNPEYNVLFDPWGNRYVYNTSTTNQETITSLGPLVGNTADDIVVFLRGQ